jgi:hypothetical protein
MAASKEAGTALSLASVQYAPGDCAPHGSDLLLHAEERCKCDPWIERRPGGGRTAAAPLGRASCADLIVAFGAPAAVAPRSQARQRRTEHARRTRGIKTMVRRAMVEVTRTRQLLG